MLEGLTALERLSVLEGLHDARSWEAEGRGGGQAEGTTGAGSVSYGLAEFIAAEEMGRIRGYWWAPDSAAVLVARVDEGPVQRLFIADAANPGQPPAEVRYPAAGTPNAEVSLVLARLDGQHTPVSWDNDAFPYLVTACGRGPARPPTRR